jgi:hypothetical protein
VLVGLSSRFQNTICRAPPVVALKLVTAVMLVEPRLALRITKTSCVLGGVGEAAMLVQRWLPVPAIRQIVVPSPERLSWSDTTVWLPVAGQPQACAIGLTPLVAVSTGER